MSVPGSFGPSWLRDGDPVERFPVQGPLWVNETRPRTSWWQTTGRHLLLFLVTAASVVYTGTMEFGGLEKGLRLAAGLLGILLAHEMGHYLACRAYRVDASLPYFIPLPVPHITFVGTLGAFIRIRSRIPDRRALLDIGLAGPFAGFAVCLPVLVLGVLEADVVPARGGSGVYLGEPLLFRMAAAALHPGLPEGLTLSLGPLGLAAWFGLFVTGLNLIPIGQLDGGHALYAVFGRLAHRLSEWGWWVCVALVYFGPSWIVWAVLLRVLGRRHPPTSNDERPLGTARRVAAGAGLLVFALCFTPDPIVWSWRDAFEAFGVSPPL